MNKDELLEYAKIWKRHKIKCPLKLWLEFVNELNDTKSCKAVKIPDNKYPSDPV